MQKKIVWPLDPIIEPIASLGVPLLLSSVVLGPLGLFICCAFNGHWIGRLMLLPYPFAIADILLTTAYAYFQRDTIKKIKDERRRAREIRIANDTRNRK